MNDQHTELNGAACPTCGATHEHTHSDGDTARPAKTPLKTEKGRAPINVELYNQEWERRKIRNKLHLSFTGCLGPCAVGNNALLLLFGQSIWFKDLNGDQYIPLIFDYIEAMLDAGRVLPAP